MPGIAFQQLATKYNDGTAVTNGMNAAAGPPASFDAKNAASITEAGMTPTTIAATAAAR